MKKTHRLTRKFSSYDLTAFTDHLMCTVANIEDALIGVGAEPGVDYNHVNLMGLAVNCVSLSGKGITLSFTLEDIEPDFSKADDPWLQIISDALKRDVSITAISVQKVIESILNINNQKASVADSARIGLIMRKLGWRRERNAKGAREWVYVRPEKAVAA